MSEAAELIFKTTPYEHQMDEIHNVLNNEAWMVGFDMGCGKSKVVVDVLNNTGARRVLIACPKTVVEVWPKEFAKHSTKRYDVLELDTGSVAKRAAKLEQSAARHLPLVAVVNYDAVWRKPMASVVNRIEWDVIICDESHRIKSPSGKASWFMAKLGRKCYKRICLTGTPLAHSMLDAYAQYRFLDPTIFGSSFTRYRNEYAVLGGFEGRQVVGFRNLDEFNRKFFSIATIVKKDDVLDLPEYTHDTREVTLSCCVESILRTP